MNEEFELRKRLQDADPGRLAPALNETVVAQAALGKAPKLASFRLARFTMAAASLSIVGLAVTSIVLPQQPQGPLFEMSASGPQGASTMGVAESSPAVGKMTQDSMMIWPGFRNNYIAGDLSKETGRGTVYQAELVGDPLDILNTLKTRFGISGEPKLDDWATEKNPSYSIQGENFSLGIFFSGAGSWYYSTWDNTAYACPSSEESGSEAGTEQFCQPTATPELIPSEAEMKRQATDLFAELGVVLESKDAKVWRSEWGGSASFPNIQNGINTGIDYFVGWGMDGKINYVSGSSFRLIERGGFNTVSAFDAVERISDGRWFGGAPASYYEAMSSATPTSRDSVTMDVQPEPGSEGEKSEVTDPNSGSMEPQVQDLVVVRSETATLSVYDASGNLWFVPGYILFNDKGWFDAIISLEEGIIQLPEPFNHDVKPLEEPQG